MLQRTGVVTLAALAFVGACSPAPAPLGEAASDSAALAGIERLHAADRRAVMARDAQALLNLWSDDPVALPPDGPNLVGRDAIAEMLSAMSQQPDTARVWRTVDYTQEFSEVEVLPGGDWGWDMGTARTVLEHRETGRRIAVRARLLRILKRAPDGEWKVHRSMWTQETPEDVGG